MSVNRSPHVVTCSISFVKILSISVAELAVILDGLVIRGNIINESIESRNFHAVEA
jgi:hypothetical protein